MTIGKRFAHNLKVIRKVNGYTQEDMAKLIGVSRTTYCYFEANGLCRAEIDYLDKICERFEVSADDLFFKEFIKENLEPVKAEEPVEENNTVLKELENIKKSIDLIAKQIVNARTRI